MNISERLERHVADLAVMYIKLHNYHWHVKGLDFQPIHEMTEGYYEGITTAYDEVAERLLQLGGKSPASMAEYLKLTNLKEETRNDFTSKDVISLIKADYEFLAKDLQETRTTAADSNDSTTDSILAGIIQDFEKAIWMLGARLK